MACRLVPLTSLRGDDLHHAGHLERLGVVDALDVGVRHQRHHHREMQGVLGHQRGHVGAVVRESARAGDAALPPREARSVELAVLRHGVRDVVHGGLAAHDLGGLHDGVDEGLVAGAAADVVVLLEPVAHIVSRRRRVGVEQALGRDDEAGRAESALHAAVRDPRLLQRMKVRGSADALDGGDFGVLVDVLHLLAARADHFAIEEHGAGATLAGVAPDLHAEETHSPQHGCQRVVRIADQHPPRAVDGQPHLCQTHFGSPLLVCAWSD